jgi:metal-sulfur cluster biosynthetic enzyme
MSQEASTHAEASSAKGQEASAHRAEASESLREQVLDALSAVYDPELDEPITTLRFVTSCDVSPDGDVQVLLRLPTPQCAPNFAFLMGADARRVVREVPGVRNVAVTLEDHYTGDEINGALDRGEGFTGAFPGETGDDDLEALRELFTRKALIARQAKVCEAMLAGGATAEQVVSATVAQLPRSPEARRSLQLRQRLAIATTPESSAFVMPNGEPLTLGQLTRWRRMARLVATSLEANGGICRSLLEVRHNLSNESEESAA